MTENQKKLHQIMIDNRITRNDLASLLKLHPGSVRAWFCDENSKRFRNIPDNTLDFLMLLLKNKKDQAM